MNFPFNSLGDLNKLIEFFDHLIHQHSESKTFTFTINVETLKIEQIDYSEVRDKIVNADPQNQAQTSLQNLIKEHGSMSQRSQSTHSSMNLEFFKLIYTSRGSIYYL